MLLLFNKTTKPLNQFAKKQKKFKRSVLGATADDFFYIFDNIFPHFFYFFSVTHKFLRTLALFKVSEKGTNRFGLIQGEIDINDRNNYREKLIM